ncbi:MAG: class I SAM-dependent methyltransferase [Flavobacteriaceae bacterium]|nr:class I SAM-dependent methyltransferase [Bacteroidia bacterium]NNL61242.1 class I SAM-dependent methyltransferase [Flavobacteriaceae bacterium]
MLPFLATAQYTEYDWEERDEWMNLDHILKAVGVESGQSIADIGCHEGYLSVHLAKRVGDRGSVYAVDVREDRLQTLDQTLESRNIQNVETIHGDYGDPKLPKNALDIVFIMDTYHEMEDYMAILEHVNKALKPGGKIIIIEKLKRRVRDQSRKSQTDAHSMSPKYVRKELFRAGFENLIQDNNIGKWENDKDKEIWMLVAKKPIN